MGFINIFWRWLSGKSNFYCVAHDLFMFKKNTEHKTF